MHKFFEYYEICYTWVDQVFICVALKYFHCRLNLLRTRFYLAGFPAINFMVINSILASENTELLQHGPPSIPVYQELPGEPVKDILGAGNDHILVLDR